MIDERLKLQVWRKAETIPGLCPLSVEARLLRGRDHARGAGQPGLILRVGDRPHSPGRVRSSRQSPARTLENVARR